MQSRLESFLRGYLLLSVRGTALQRFLQMCAFHGLTFWKLSGSGEQYQTYLSVRDFRRLAPICRKTRTRVHILEKHGLPFFLAKNRKRKAFFLGFLLCAGLLYGFSGHIWQIQITGNYTNSTPAIRDFLGQQDVVWGVAKKKLNCARISASIREEFSTVTWVSAKIDGTKLKITIKENSISEETKSAGEAPSDLVAEHSGKIVSMVTRQGTPVKKVGELCRTGEVLVSGKIEIKNDSQEVVRNEYVKADADVIVEYRLQYRDSFPMKYEQRIYEEKERVSYALGIGGWRIGSAVPVAEKNQDVVREQFIWEPSREFTHPVFFEKQRKRNFQTVSRTYSKEEAKEKAKVRLEAVLENFLEKGVEISQNNVKITLNQNSCVSEGILVVQGEAGTEWLITEQTQPEERELLDEQ